MSVKDIRPEWDNKTVNYNLQEHNWPDFWLEVAKERFFNIESLESVHNTLKPSRTLLEQYGQLFQHIPQHLQIFA